MATEGTARKSRTPIIAGVSIIVVFLVLGFALSTRFGDDPGRTGAAAVGKPVPNLTLEYMEGPGSVDLAAIDGVAVLNFWAPWCLACRFEHPLLVEAAEAYPEVEFYGVLYNDSPSNAVAWLDQFGRGYPTLLDPDLRAAVEFGLFGVPETFFVNDGEVVAKVSGALNADTLVETLHSIFLGGQPGEMTTGTVQSRSD